MEVAPFIQTLLLLLLLLYLVAKGHENHPQLLLSWLSCTMYTRFMLLVVGSWAEKGSYRLVLASQ